jgi:hypothetical protein
VPEFQAGLGGVNLKFYYSQQYCDIFAGCSTSNSYLESSNHFSATPFCRGEILRHSQFLYPSAGGRALGE